MNLKNSIHCFQRYAVIYSSIFLNSVLALLVYGARTHGNAPICSWRTCGRLIDSRSMDAFGNHFWPSDCKSEWHVLWLAPSVCQMIFLGSPHMEKIPTRAYRSCTRQTIKGNRD